jgi:hypothetical protein
VVPDSLTATRRFGITPAKESVSVTSAEAQERAAKAKATREKNGTMGSKQKKTLDATSSPSTTPQSPAKP